jgi:hypothetical protein
MPRTRAASVTHYDSVTIRLPSRSVQNQSDLKADGAATRGVAHPLNRVLKAFTSRGLDAPAIRYCAVTPLH